MIVTVVATSMVAAKLRRLTAEPVRSTRSSEAVQSYERDSRRSAWLPNISFAGVCAILFLLSLTALLSSALPES